MAAGAGGEAFLQLMDRIDQFTLGRVWTELTDDELLWEPAPGSWSVRRREDCRTPDPFGAGELVVDFGPEPTPTPMTTIAWLLWHVASLPGRFVELDIAGGTRAMSSGWSSPYLTHHPIFTTAAEAAAAFWPGWFGFRAAVEAMTDEHLATTTARYTYAAEAPRDGLCVLGEPGPQHPVSFFVAGVLNEVHHHGVQICVLRDLYANRAMA